MVFLRLPALAHALLLILFVFACALIPGRVDMGAQSPGRPSNLVTVQLAREADVSIVTLEADGPLPEPTFGVAHDPFRFYVDFPNVAPESRGVLNSTDPFVLRVRVAPYSTEPLILRVVLDLKRELPIRVDTDGRGAGRIKILVGMNRATTAAKASTPAQTSLPPVPSLPPNPVAAPTGNVQAPPPSKPPAQSPPPQSQNPAPQQPQANKPTSQTPSEKPPTAPVMPPPVQMPPQAPPVKPSPSQPSVQSTPSSTPAPPPSKAAEPASTMAGGTSGSPPPPPGFNPLASPPANPIKPTKGDDRYRSQITAPLEQLRGLRPMLASIDLLKADTPTGLPAAIERVESIRQTLAAVKPPPDQGPTHDMLLQSCTLAQRALKLRVSAADAAALRNAGSAAAGALLLLDRVCIELGCDASAVKR